MVRLLRWIDCPHDDQSGHLDEQQGIEHPLRHEAAATAASGTLSGGGRWQAYSALALYRGKDTRATMRTVC